MTFFRNPQDLAGWVKGCGSAEKAATILANLPKIGEQHAADVAETTKRIVAANDENAAAVLLEILRQAGVGSEDVSKVEAKVDHVEAADEMLRRKLVTAEQHAGILKEAQIARQPGQYEMPLRLCPKLPWSVGKKLISTYNCRHYCLDGIVLDDDPMRVFCGELLWRRHMMDKFSSDFQDRQTGELVGGYINERFYKFPDAGTPANKDVPRDGGNPMALKPGERTRAPRPHQWSTERRMQEAREKGSTKDIVLNKTAARRRVEARMSEGEWQQLYDLVKSKQCNQRRNDGTCSCGRGPLNPCAEAEGLADDILSMAVDGHMEHYSLGALVDWLGKKKCRNAPECGHPACARIDDFIGLVQDEPDVGDSGVHAEPGMRAASADKKMALAAAWNAEFSRRLAAEGDGFWVTSARIDKTAGGWGRFSEDLADCLEAQALIHRGLPDDAWVAAVKGELGDLMAAEQMTDQELLEFRHDNFVQHMVSEYGKRNDRPTTASGWLKRMVEAQVSVDSVEHSSYARGTIVKNVGGVEVELDWTYSEAHDVGEVEFEWPEDMMMDIEKTPGSWNGDVCNPDTRELIVSGENREALESQWQAEVEAALSNPNADIMASSKLHVVEAKKKGKPVNPWAVCTKSVGRDDKEKYEGCVMDVKEEHPVKADAEAVAKRVIFAATQDSFVRLSSEVVEETMGEGNVVEAFTMAVDLHNEGVAAADAAMRIAEKTGLPITSAVRIQSVAIRKMASHVSDRYKAPVAKVDGKDAKKKVVPPVGQDVVQDAVDVGLVE